MQTLIAVYRDRETADAVADELHARHHAPDASVRVGEAADARASVAAEMDAEVEHSWASGAFGLVTAEMMRAATLFGAAGFAIGAVMGLPIGLLLYDPSVSTVTRLAIGAFVGALFGSVVGALLGGGMGMKSHEERLAAERGVPVAVDVEANAAEPLESVFARFDPIRMDRFVNGQRIGTPHTEEPSGVQETLAEFVANTADAARR